MSGEPMTNAIPLDLPPGELFRFLEHVAQTEETDALNALEQPTPPSPSSTTTCSA
jgi:hypothetical protein